MLGRAWVLGAPHTRCEAATCSREGKCGLGCIKGVSGIRCRRQPYHSRSPLDHSAQGWAPRFKDMEVFEGPEVGGKNDLWVEMRLG